MQTAILIFVAAMLLSAPVLLTLRSRRRKTRMGAAALELERDVLLDPAEHALLSHGLRLKELRGDKTVLRLKALDQSPPADRAMHLAAILDVVEASQYYVLDSTCPWSDEELLARASELERERSVAPELTARHLRLLGCWQISRGDNDLATKTLEEALALHEHNNDTRSRNYFEASAALGMLYFNGGRYAESAPLLRRAYDAYRRARAIPPALAVRCLDTLGDMHVAKGQGSTAEPLFAEARALYQQSNDRNYAIFSDLYDQLKRSQPQLKGS